MKIIKTKLPEVVLLEPKVFGDARGFFKETWSERHFSEMGLDINFVQDNVSRSTRGVLRGLHFQNPKSQGKLVTVLEGEVFDVAVDIRYGSSTFGQWEAVTLNAENHRQLYVPPGFAHGFVVMSETALFSYKCTDFYHPEHESTIRWDDPELAIPWPTSDVQVSEKDAQGFLLKDLPRERMVFEGISS